VRTLQRSRSQAKRRQQQRWRERVKSGLPYVGGDPWPVVIERLIEYEHLNPDQAAHPHAIFDAMMRALATLPKIKL